MPHLGVMLDQKLLEHRAEELTNISRAIYVTANQNQFKAHQPEQQGSKRRKIERKVVDWRHLF
jgi:hypothetical protein